jgi:hypothetical protein
MVIWQVKKPSIGGGTRTKKRFSSEGVDLSNSDIVSEAHIHDNFNSWDKVTVSSLFAGFWGVCHEQLRMRLPFL